MNHGIAASSATLRVGIPRNDNSIVHKPVLLKEVLEYFDPKPGQNFIDCTIGLGGHSLAILEKTKPNGKVLGIDLDKKSLEHLKQQANKRLILQQGNFSDLKKIASENNFSEVDGILLDLGMSSWQLEKSGRGISFQKDEILDMRFDPINNDLTAEEIVNNWTEQELKKVFQEYGQERLSGRIAKEIVSQRKISRITASKQLADLIVKIYPRRQVGKIHPATKVFQALRIAVNNELENLKNVLPQALDILKPKGRIIVISFHSLEDRIVKIFFKEEAKKNNLKILTKKPIVPSSEEIEFNPRSRSAKLRAIEKI